MTAERLMDCAVGLLFRGSAFSPAELAYSAGVSVEQAEARIAELVALGSVEPAGGGKYAATLAGLTNLVQ